MSAAQVDPHDKMRSRDVNRVARGEQASRPAHEYGSIRSAPPKPTPSTPPPRSYEEEVEEEHNPLGHSRGTAIYICWLPAVLQVSLNTTNLSQLFY